MKYLLLLMICLSLSWTASSQVTGIPESNKREIVKTLLSYPLVTAELDSLYGAYELRGMVIVQKDSVISLQGQKIEQYIQVIQLKDEQINLLKDKGKGKGFWWGLVGFALGALLVQ